MTTQRAFTRMLPCDESWDVIVAGGGPAGCTAAIAAAREGKRVLLVEATGALGGMGTMGLVPAWCPFSDGEKIIYRGLAERIFLASKAAVPHEPAHKMDWVAIDPEALKCIYDEMVTAAGVTVLFHTRLAAVEVDEGVVCALILANKDGLTAIRAGVYIDATGDGDLAAWAGAAYAKGDENGAMQPTTLCFLFSHVDSYAYQHGHAPARDQMLSRVDSVKYPRLSDLHLCNNLVGQDTVGFNSGHLWDVDHTDPAQVSRAMMDGRQIARQFREALAEYLPAAFGNAHLAATAPLLGARETRRILGDYVLTTDDYLTRRGFTDEIARNSYPIDIHVAKDEIDAALRGEVHAMDRYARFGPGESHGIPYRCLTPRGLRNVLVAGRCISTDRPVQASTRVMPVCLVTGEAVGTASALACDAGGDVRAVNVPTLQARLRAAGAYLPEAVEVSRA